MKKDKLNENLKNEENFAEENETAEETQDVDDEKNDALDLLQKERDKLKDDFLRALADVENMKRRCAQEIEKNNKYAIANFAKALLPVADNLQRAIDSAKNGENCAEFGNFLQGVELTQQELNKVFAKFGVKKMEIMGKVFDPNFHQVVQEVPDPEKEAGTVVAELQTGYMIEDRILREAMVIVSKK